MAVTPAHIHTFPFLSPTCQLPPLLAAHPVEITAQERKRCKELCGEIRNQILFIFVLAKEQRSVAWLPARRMSEVAGGWTRPGGWCPLPVVVPDLFQFTGLVLAFLLKSPFSMDSRLQRSWH